MTVNEVVRASRAIREGSWRSRERVGPANEPDSFTLMTEVARASRAPRLESRAPTDDPPRRPSRAGDEGARGERGFARRMGGGVRGRRDGGCGGGSGRGREEGGWKGWGGLTRVGGGLFRGRKASVPLQGQRKVRGSGPPDTRPPTDNRFFIGTQGFLIFTEGSLVLPLGPEFDRGQ